MKKLFIIVLLIVGLLIPAVSAEVLYDETIEFYEFTGGSGSATGGGGLSGTGTFKDLCFKDISKIHDLGYVVVETPASTLHPEGVVEFTYQLGGKTNTATMHVKYIRNILNQHTGTRYTLFYNNWDVTGLTGAVTVETPSLYSGQRTGNEAITPDDCPVYVRGYVSSTYKVTCSAGINFRNRILITDNNNELTVKLHRTVYGIQSPSQLNVYGKTGSLLYSDYSISDVTEYFLTNEVDNVTIVAFDRSYKYSISSETLPPTSDYVTVYVRDSQTGALLANAHIVINASVNNEFFEVVNVTLPSGIYTGNLQPTGGGLPNPDYYRLIATAEGYNSIMPYIDFEVDRATTIYVYMEPTGGAPVDENKTFIDFYVRDLNANPVSGATVKFGAYTLITNSAGYTIFEVDKDKTYTWIVSKSGYGSVTGNANIGSNARYTINAVIAPAVTPTLTTPIPTSTTVGPTPTMTAPTGEPVSNLLEWFAAHFGMLLGGGVEVGKIFMWLCFAVPAGVYVGKEAKAGAAGFMAGAGVVTLFFVIIGWVPVWLLVLLALIIGLLYAKVFSNSDHGGGR